jgi:GNAT superfamily N-acetyltransferase
VKPGIGPVEPLDGAHDLDAFDCGSAPLDRFLKVHALGNQAAESVRTYVVCRAPRRVVGYYSLCTGGVERERAPARVAKGLAAHPIPVMLLARLAVDRGAQGRGIGRALLKDALARTASAADIAGIRALIVHAKDDAARAWYAKFDFEPSPSDPFHLFLMLKDIRASLPR